MQFIRGRLNGLTNSTDLFEQKKGYFRETENDAVMEKVDEEGNIIGFSILRVSELKENPLSIELTEPISSSFEEKSCS